MEEGETKIIHDRRKSGLTPQQQLEVEAIQKRSPLSKESIADIKEVVENASTKLCSNLKEDITKIINEKEGELSRRLNAHAERIAAAESRITMMMWITGISIGALTTMVAGILSGFIGRS